MGHFKLDRGLVLRIGQSQWQFHRQVGPGVVQIENQDTGLVRRESISKVTKCIMDGKYVVVREADHATLEQDAARVSEIFSIDALSEPQKTSYLRAHAYLTGMRKRHITKGQRTRIASVIPIIAASICDINPPSTSTVMSWMRIFEASGANVHSLVTGYKFRRSAKRISHRVRAVVERVLQNYYFVRNGCSQRIAHARIARELEQFIALGDGESDETSISLSTVRRVISEIHPYDRDRIRLGAIQTNARWRFSTHGQYASRPLERIEMDHTIVDLWVIDDRLGIPLGRPMITILVCGHSKYITGVFISFEGESIARVARSLKIAIQPKEDIISGIGLENPWHSMGLWETLVLDNSLAFHSPRVREMLIELNMDIEYCPVRMPWFKPSVERYIGEICRQLPALGRPQKPGRHAEPIDPRVTACVTFSDLCEGILKWVVDVHPFSIHREKLSRPIDLFLEGLERCPPPAFPLNFQQLDILAGIKKIATVDQSGVVNHSLQYASEELKFLRRDIGTKFTTSIKFDPYDLGAIFVQHPHHETWIRVPAKNQEYAAGLSLTQHKIIRQYARMHLGAVNADSHYRRALLELQDHWAKSIHAGKGIKRDAKKYAQLRNFSSASSAPVNGAAETSLRMPTASAIVPDDNATPENRRIPTFKTSSSEDL